ncbi:unnamed protein product [Anisakis simplex]|uniref:Uncharacterized protein n=1 Tax=Anisakis simplex TaxID=6269 RepID=A0A0M3J9W5_ANISI|nr:unnamed protein product [Anisakis simplex]
MADNECNLNLSNKIWIFEFHHYSYVRRSQRKAGQAPRRDDPFDPKGSNSNDGSTDDASTSYLTAKKIKSEETGRTREGDEYQATVVPTEEWMEPPESYRCRIIQSDSRNLRNSFSRNKVLSKLKNVTGLIHAQHTYFCILTKTLFKKPL